MRELPKDKSFRGNQHQEVNSHVRELTKSDALTDANISKSEAYRLQRLADHPDVVEAVIQDAEIRKNFSRAVLDTLSGWP